MSREVVRQYIGKVYLIYPSMAAAELGLPVIIVRETLNEIYQRAESVNGRRLIKRIDQDYCSGSEPVEDRHYFEVEL